MELHSHRVQKGGHWGHPRLPSSITEKNSVSHLFPGLNKHVVSDLRDQEGKNKKEIRYWLF